MKQSLTKKIAAYTGAAGAFIAFAGNAEAQIVYTDVTPDVTLDAINYDSYAIDFNSDANIDFEIGTSIYISTFTSSSLTYTYTFMSAGIVPYSSAFGIQGSGAFATALNLNDSINAFQIFTANPSIWNLGYTYGFGANGNFPGYGDKYIGVKFLIGANTHYGWILVNMAADCGSITLKGFAYESTPNTNILAGVTTTVDLQNIDNQIFSVFPSPAVNDIQIQLPVAGNVSIIDFSGKALMSFDAEAGNHNLDISHLPSGMYFVKHISIDGIVEMQKIIVAK